MKTINALGRDVDRCIKTKRVVGPGKSVVDGFGNGHHAHNAFFMKSERDLERLLPSDGDEGVKTIAFIVIFDHLKVLGIVERIVAGSSKDRTAAVKDAGCGTKIKNSGVVLN